MSLNGLALCAGVGGLEIGLGLALGDSYRTVCYVEREAYAAAILVARMEEGILAPAPIWDDLRTFSGYEWRGKVDIVSAGFPCQPFSSASRGRKVFIDLWPHVLRVVLECQPTYLFLENVPKGLDGSEKSLLELGWMVSGPICVSASDVGANHLRRRHWLLAHSNLYGEPVLSFHDETPGSQDLWWSSGPPTLGVDDGSPTRLDRLRSCGNGVVPLAAAHAFRSLASAP